MIEPAELPVISKPSNSGLMLIRWCVRCLQSSHEKFPGLVIMLLWVQAVPPPSGHLFRQISSDKFLLRTSITPTQGDLLDAQRRPKRAQHAGTAQQLHFALSNVNLRLQVKNTTHLHQLDRGGVCSVGEHRAQYQRGVDDHQI